MWNRSLSAPLLSIAIVCGLARPAFGGGQDGAAPASVALSVTLEDTVFLEDQSIHMIICLRNRTGALLYDISPLTPGSGYLHLSLERKGNSSPLEQTMLLPISVRVREGEPLRPSEARCDVRDLVSYYGGSPGDRAGFAARLGFESLRPGQYRLSGKFELHTGFRKGIPQEVVTFAPIQFEIRPLQSNPREAALVRSFLSSMPAVGNDRTPLHAHAETWLPRFYGSPYLLRVYLSTGYRVGRLDFEKLMDSLIAVGVNDSRRAALLGLWFQLDDRFTDRRAGWYERLSGKTTGRVERDVLEASGVKRQ